MTEKVTSIKPSSIREAAEKAVAEERAAAALAAMKDKMRKLAAAKAIVSNLEREVADLEQSIEEGSFSA